MKNVLLVLLGMLLAVCIWVGCWFWTARDVMRSRSVWVDWATYLWATVWVLTVGVAAWSTYQ